MLQFERQAWRQGFKRVAGVDEVGRGPLAGCVVAAAVVLDRTYVETEERALFRDLTDSKKLTAGTRELFFSILTQSPLVDVGVGVSDVEEIDRLNILKATHLAMARAVTSLAAPPDHVLVDGLPVRTFPCSSTSIVRGDALSLSIAAASVVAKVVRDQAMRTLDREYPQYGFARHKGYGTSDHVQALLEYGPCPVHRRTFRPVRDALDLHLRARTRREESLFSLAGLEA